MAKNRVAPDTSKPKDKFFDRSKSKFRSKIKIGQNKKKLNIPDFQNRNQHTSKEQYNERNSSGSNFFVKSNNTMMKEVSKRPKTNNIDTDKLKSDKKPFDKKKYRLQKYSNKYKLQQWEDKRKKAVLRGYYRNLKEDERKLDVKQIYEEHEGEINSESESVDEKIHEQNENNLNESISQNSRKNSTFEEKIIVPGNSKGKKNKAFKKAHLEFQRIKEEKQKQHEELLKKKAERKEALQEYKRKKVEKFKKLSRKTKRGQPIMKDRLEMLLEKIQNSVKC